MERFKFSLGAQGGLTLLVCGVVASCGGGSSGPILPRASKSSTVAVTTDDARALLSVAAADRVVLVDLATEAVVATVQVGDEPGSVVVHPDDATAYVANRGDGTVSVLTGIDTATPVVAETIEVGSEPAGLALSPSGRSLFVAEWAEGRVVRIDTRSRRITGEIEGVRNPYALSVTNDGDGRDDDETLVVPEFFGEPVPGQREGTDTSRRGRVRVFDTNDALTERDAFVFGAIDSGFAPSTAGAGAATVQASPNQLYGVAVAGPRFYVTSISASPATPIDFQTNVQPIVYVGDLATGLPVPTAAAGTANLAALVRDQLPAPRIFLADIVDLAFVGDTVAYVLARGAETLQRVTYDAQNATSPVSLGAASRPQIDLNVAPAAGSPRCQTPTGVVTTHAGTRAIVNCSATQAVGFVDLGRQQLASTTVLVPIVGEAATRLAEGRHVFFTSRGRWSRDGWSDCASCHADGFTDNITWIFPTGPRQATSLDGSFSHAPGQPQIQRAFNWTAIFDEVHDFERNTRTVSGGLGAITKPMAGDLTRCGTLAQELAVSTDALANLGDSMAALADRTRDPALCPSADDWDKMDEWIRTIRPPAARRTLDPESVARGRALFGAPSAATNAAGCVSCHGGAGWTVSRRFYDPEQAIPVGSSNFAGEVLAASPFSAGALAAFNNHTLQIQNQLVQPDADGFEAVDPVPGGEISCVIREVGTFGVEGDVAATDLLELRANAFTATSTGGTTFRAQGRGGYNVPSLYGLSLGAPYLHHGQAQTLEALLGLDAEGGFDSTSPYLVHLTAANPNFLTAFPDDAARAAALRDLVAFLRSIDATTTTFSLAAGDDVCRPTGSVTP